MPDFRADGHKNKFRLQHAIFTISWKLYISLGDTDVAEDRASIAGNNTPQTGNISPPVSRFVGNALLNV